MITYNLLEALWSDGDLHAEGVYMAPEKLHNVVVLSLYSMYRNMFNMIKVHITKLVADRKKLIYW